MRNDKRKKQICFCGSLLEYSEDLSVPIISNKKKTKFFLLLDESKKIPMNYCFFCGGNKMGPLENTIEPCDCNSVENFIAENDSTIKYDSKSEEYFLLGENNRKSFLYFCFVCGGRLPESKNDEFSLASSESEVNEIHEKIKNAKTVDKLIKILGVPDEKVITDLAEIKKQKLLGRKPVKQTLVYNSIADTFSLIVVEDEDGKIHFLSAGKPKTN